MATFLACPSAGTRRSAPAFAHAGRDRDASTPRSRRHREEQCHRLRPAVCAIADAGRPVRPRRRLGVPSACAAVAANGTFFSQRLGQLRTADANTLARFDLGAQAGDGPIASVGRGLLQLRRDHTQRRFTLHRGGAGRHARFQRLNTAACEVTAPQVNRVVAHAKRLRDLRACPTSQRQKHGACPVRLAAIPRAGKRRKRSALFVGCRERRLSSNILPLRIGAAIDSEPLALVNRAESA